MALFRELDANNFNSKNGRARCAFEDETAVEANIRPCAAREEAVRIGAEFKHDSGLWKVRLGDPDMSCNSHLHFQQTEFLDVLEILNTKGYFRQSCGDDVCKLQL